MPDLCWNGRALSDLKYLLQRFEDACALGALMREVDPAMARGDLRELDNLIGGREAIRHILERGAEAERALLHCLLDKLPHRVELGGRRRTVVLANNVVADATGPDECGDVDGRMRAELEPAEVVGERAPVLRHAEMSGTRRGLADHPIVDGRDRRTLPCHFCRHALVNFAGCAAVDEHVELRLAEQIDEAGCHDQIRRVDAHRSAGLR